MMRAMDAAVSGLKNHQLLLDVTANNIANVNTVGYKASRATFADSLAQTVIGATAEGNGQAGRNSAQVGLGVQLGSIDNLMSGGSLESTGETTDLAIEGEGMFIVADGTPPAVPTQVEYTRAGNFTFNAEGYLTTQSGEYVLGRKESGEGTPNSYIKVPAGATDVSIGQDGAVSYIPEGGEEREIAGYLSIARFKNEPGLERTTGSNWVESAASGKAEDGTPGGGKFGLTISGTLEMSNVELATEFTNMIDAQRGFEANSRTITTADEMLQNLVNLGR